MKKKHNKQFGKQDLLSDEFDTAFSKPTVSNVATSGYQKCYETHPALKIGEYEIYGGSCINPCVLDADIYIGFDSGMKNTVQYPWNESAVQHVYFHITDMSIPKDLVQFKKMLDWIELKLKEGKKIHMGCIGGHGRTGTVMAALVKQMLGIDDAITYVRENYCKKVVESSEQINFLVQNFGISKVEPTKGGHMWSSNTPTPGLASKQPQSWASSRVTSLFSDTRGRNSVVEPRTTGNKERINAGVHKELHDVTPVLVIGNVWGN